MAGLFIATVIFHIGLRLVGARRGFRTTFYVIGYSTATLLISLLPVFLKLLTFLFSFKIPSPSIGIAIILIGIIVAYIASLLAQIWPLVVLNIGFKYLQKLNFARTIGATFISLSLGLGLLFFVGIVTTLYIPQFTEQFDKIKGEIVSKLVGVGWKIQTVDKEGDVGEYSSIAIDKEGGIHISYYDASNHNLKYAYWNGSKWQIQVVDSMWKNGYTNSICLDKDNRPHISYYTWVVPRKQCHLRYAYWDGSKWKFEVVDMEGNVGFCSCIKLDSKGRPHISYYDNSLEAIRYAFKTNSEWKKFIVDRGIWGGGKWEAAIDTSLALDSQGRPHIAYFDQCNLDLKYAFWNGLEWKIQTVESRGEVGMKPSLALDKKDRVYIAYKDATTQTLKLASLIKGKWKIQVVDKNGRLPSIKIDKQGNPHIAYIAGPGQHLKYAYWTGTRWKIETVERQRLGWSTHYVEKLSLALDKEDKPYISYYDGNEQDLKCAHK